MKLIELWSQETAAAGLATLRCTAAAFLDEPGCMSISEDGVGCCAQSGNGMLEEASRSSSRRAYKVHCARAHERLCLMRSVCVGVGVFVRIFYDAFFVSSSALNIIS